MSMGSSLRSPAGRRAGLLCVVAIAVACALVRAPAAAADSQTFAATADSYVNSADPTTNYGTHTRLWLGGSSPVMRAYVRFDVELPAGATITGATLRMYAGAGSTLVGYQAYAVSDTSWGESTITYENAPTLGTELGTSGGWAVGDAYMPITLPAGYVHAGLNSVGLARAAASTYDLWSREAEANLPELEVSYSTTASPADSTPPTSAASAPQYSTSSGFTVSYSASDDAGGSGLGEVDLYAKGPADSGYAKVASDTSGSGSGSFSFTASEGNGSYSFYTIATDKAGNRELAPAGPDSTTLVDLTAPTSSASSPQYSKSPSLNVSYTASDDAGGSGLGEVDLYAKGPADSGYVKVASDSSGAGSGSFAYSAAEGGGGYSFYTVAIDKAGNSEAAPAGPDSTTLLDTVVPSSSAGSPASSTSSGITVSYSASDNAGGSGLAEVDLYAKGPADSGYAKVASDTSGSGSGSFSFTATEGDGSYSFYTVAVDKAGNVEATPSGPDSTTAVNAASDTTPPSSAASSPQYSRSSAFTVSYSASDNADGSGLAEVDLYAKGPADSGYAKVASDTSGSGSGSFSFTATEGDGSYSFYTVAVDKAGNREAAPAGPDARTTLDTSAPSAPTNLTTTAGVDQVSLSWSASSDNVGVAGYQVLRNGTPVATTSQTSFTDTGLTSGTSYSYTVQAFDAAGNVSAASNTATATAKAPTFTGTAPALRYMYSDHSASAGYGFNLMDVSSKAAADSTPAGTKGLIWIGQYENSTCQFQLSDSQVQAGLAGAAGDAKIAGYFLADEPNPNACPNAPAQIAARSQLVHQTDTNPSHFTLMVMDSNSGSASLNQIPLWKGVTDYVGLDPYPCYQNKPCDFAWIDQIISAADSAGLKYWGVVQAFNDATCRWPTPDELTHMLNQWAASHEQGYGVFAWHWAGNTLTSQPALLNVLQQFNATAGTATTTTDTTAPSVPTGLSATAGDARVSLSWNASTDPDDPVASYNIYRSGTKIASSTTTSYTDTGLTNGSTYSYQVSAVDTHGNESALSTTVNATPQAPPPSSTPTAPTGLAAAAGNAQASLTWNASSDAVDAVASYNIYRNGTKVASSATTSYTDTGLTNGTTYSYQVSAVDAAGNESALSGSVSVTPQASPPATPHIMDIIMENHGAGAIIGNSSAPFQNSLATSYITLTNWTGIDHPSAPNYVGMVSGQDNGLAGAGDCSPSIGSSCDWSGDNLGNQMFAAGINAKWFAEDLKGSGCSISNSESGNNDVNHEPWAYMDMWQATPGACAQAGLTTASPSDPEVISALQSANPPSFVWLTPNLTDDTHNGTVSQGDTYLKNLVTAVQATSWYTSGGTIIITYDEDEGESNPTGYCTNPVLIPAVGNHCIATFLISAKDANVGAVATPGDHYGMLRSIEECYSLPLLNNAAATTSFGQATYGDIKNRLC